MLHLLLIAVWACLIRVKSFPLPDSGPHLANDWGQPVRHRHLYAARRGLHLQIHTDGKITGSHVQTLHSLLEIWPVDTGFVAIKGVASSRFLCMERHGKLYGSHIYTQEDCSFIERVLPDGYNIYISSKHGALVNLGGGKNNKDGTSLSQFLPMLNTLPQEPTSDHQSGEQRSPIDPEHDLQLGLQIDSMDPFGKMSQIVIQSPSFNKRWAVNHHLWMFWGSDPELKVQVLMQKQRTVWDKSGAQGKTFKRTCNGQFHTQWRRTCRGAMDCKQKQITPILETLSLSGALTAVWVYLFIFHCLCNDPSLCIV